MNMIYIRSMGTRFGVLNFRLNDNSSEVRCSAIRSQLTVIIQMGELHSKSNEITLSDFQTNFFLRLIFTR